MFTVGLLEEFSLADRQPWLLADGLCGLHGLSSFVLCLNLLHCHLSTLRTAPSVFTCGQYTGLQNVFPTDFPEWLSRTDSSSVDLIPLLVWVWLIHLDHYSFNPDDITDSVHMCLSKLREIVKDRGVWRAAVHGVAKCQTGLSDWKTTGSLEAFPYLLPLL